jgi:hypothetical protein
LYALFQFQRAQLYLLLKSGSCYSILEERLSHGKGDDIFVLKLHSTVHIDYGNDYGDFFFLISKTKVILIYQV